MTDPQAVAALSTGAHDRVRAIRWRDSRLELLDQRLLPAEETWLELDNCPAVARAITDLVVRGAPAIGITAAYGVALSLQSHQHLPEAERQAALAKDMQTLRQARPTAINLNWAVDQLQPLLALPPAEGLARAVAMADAMHLEDIEANRAMGAMGAALIDPGSRVLTHCNTGSLATGGYGTALGVIRSAWAEGRLKEVFADETRPWLQGARLTAWELARDDIPCHLVIDGAGSWLMQQKNIDWLIVGADRVAANGDVANKIGTYHAAVAARHHGVKVMVVIPTATLDMNVASGAEIPIEQRAEEEITRLGDQQVAAPGSAAWNPVFDVTPADLVDVLVTEKGVLRHPDRASIEALMAAPDTN